MIWMITECIDDWEWVLSDKEKTVSLPSFDLTEEKKFLAEVSLNDESVSWNFSCTKQLSAVKSFLVDRLR